MNWIPFLEEDGDKISIIGVELISLNERKMGKVNTKVDEPNVKPCFIIYITYGYSHMFNPPMVRPYIITDGNMYNDILFKNDNRINVSGLFNLGKLAKAAICNAIKDYVGGEV